MDALGTVMTPELLGLGVPWFVLIYYSFMCDIALLLDTSTTRDAE